MFLNRLSGNTDAGKTFEFYHLGFIGKIALLKTRKNSNSFKDTYTDRINSFSLF
jgi:hypothetical protein